MEEKKKWIGYFILIFCFVFVVGWGLKKIKPTFQVEDYVKSNILERSSAIIKFNPTKEESEFSDWFSLRQGVMGAPVPKIMQGDFGGINRKGMAMFVLREYKTFKKEGNAKN